MVAVLLANAVYLLGVRSNDPMLYHSGLGSPTHGLTDIGPDSGHYPHTIDANDGWTVQSLGKRVEMVTQSLEATQTTSGAIAAEIERMFDDTHQSFVTLANELAQFRSDRARAARFAAIADELERLERA